MKRKSVENSNPFFTVEREKLYRKDGVYTEYDALYRADDASQLSVVSSGYQLVPHREAVDFVLHVLDDVGIEERKVDFSMASNGAKMFMTIKFPEYEFNPADSGVESTALDSVYDKKDDRYIPQIVVRNSYDKSSTLDITYGAFRFVCKNGVMLGDTVMQTRLTHFGNNVDLDVLRMPLVANLEKTIEGIAQNYTRMNSIDGIPYMALLLEREMLAGKYERMMLSMLEDQVQVEFKEEQEDGKRRFELKPVRELTAYMVWCVLTEIATHHVHSVMARQNMSRKIADVFIE